MLKLVCLVLAVLVVTKAIKLKKNKDLTKKPEFVRRQASTCGDGRFECTSGECIMLDWTCDNQFDCFDGSDERDCPCECSGEHQFKCRNGPCIPVSFLCDYDDNCGDGSDETNCDHASCGPDQIQCDNMKCIYETWLCDGDDDCRNGLDESDEQCGGTCNSQQFQCADGSRCIPIHMKCNGDRNCADGSDEADCVCNDDQFKCAGGRCIPGSWHCDGDNDCGDYSDEIGCPTLHPSVCSDIMSIRDCVLMNETAKPICEHGELGFKYCRKFCDLCQSQE
ncbi:very low-density lipoprotein receptor-like [Pomacea canaliculata]|uniref:very low-density lipoprotein receptor-like n=1 Tax=Pomacea canaliculata TaxID=400727 RepID=UPI000D72E652|nr:very low-density lipoprotein receptor-like [Pomacea canaliculata]